VVAKRLRTTGVLWRRSLVLLFDAAPGQTIAMGLLMLLQGFLPVGTLLAARNVDAAAADALKPVGAPAGTAGDLPLSLWIAIAAGVIVVQQTVVPVFRAIQESASDLLTAHVNGELIAAASRWRGLARFEDPAFADHLATARSRAALSPVDLVSYGGRFVQSLCTVAAMGVALWRLHPLAPVILLLAHIPQSLQENTFGQKMANALQLQGQDGRRLASYRDAVLGAGAAKDVRLFDLGEFFLRLYGTLFSRTTDEIRALRLRLMRRMAPAQLLSGAAIAAVYLYAVYRVLEGGLSLGDLVLFGGALIQIQAALWLAGFDVGFLGRSSPGCLASSPSSTPSPTSRFHLLSTPFLRHGPYARA